MPPALGEALTATVYWGSTKLATRVVQARPMGADRCADRPTLDKASSSAVSTSASYTFTVTGVRAIGGMAIGSRMRENWLGG
jgi:hypothetical protein